MTVRVVATVTGVVIGVLLAILWWLPAHRHHAFDRIAQLQPRIARPPVVPVVPPTGPSATPVPGPGPGPAPTPGATGALSGIAGKLRDLDGAPLAGVTVRHDGRTAVTDREGHFSIALSPGAYVLHRREPGTPRHPVVVPVGQFATLALVAADRQPILITGGPS